MSYISEFFNIVTSQDEPDLEAFHSVLDKVITSNGECVPVDADDHETIKKKFSHKTVFLTTSHASNLRWLSQILINQCITHFDLKHQQMLAAFINRLLSTESPAYVDVLYAVKHYFTSVGELLQSSEFHGLVHALNKRLAHHHLTENHANKVMTFLKTGPSDAYVGEKSVFLNILNDSAEEGSPFQWESIIKDQDGRCTPFALMAIKSLSMAEFIGYVERVTSQSTNKVILTSSHHEVMHQQIDRLIQADDMPGVANVLALFRFLGMGIDAKEARGRTILMAFFSKRLIQQDNFSHLLTALNTNLDACFEVYQSLAPEKRVGPVDEKYIVFLKDKLQWPPTAILDHLSLIEKQSLPAELYLQLAQEAGLAFRDIRATLTKKQNEDLVEATSQKIKNSDSLLEVREHLLSAHASGMKLGALEYDLLNSLPNLDKETALLLFTSDDLQNQSRCYVVNKRGERKKQGDLFYYGLNRIIFTALLALDPEVYQRPADEHLGLTSFEDAFRYWMITLTFQHRSSIVSYEGAIFHDNFDPKIEIQPSYDDHIHYKRDPRGHAHPKLCTDKALEKRLNTAQVEDTPETLAGNTPIDHGQIAAMLALKKIGLHYDRHGVKHGFQKILDMRPRLKNACCDHPLLCGGYYIEGDSVLENILMSHQSSEELSAKTKEFKALQEARKKQPISPEGLPLLKEVLDRSKGVLLKQAVIYLVSSLEPNDEDVLSVVKKHLWVSHELSDQRSIEFVFDCLDSAQLERLKTRLVKCVLGNPDLRAKVRSAEITKKYILLTVLCLEPRSIGVRVLSEAVGDEDRYCLRNTQHWKALNVHLDATSSPALLAKFGKFAGVPSEKEGDSASLSILSAKPTLGN